MNPKTIQAIVLGVAIPSFVFVIIIIWFFLWRRNRANQAYHQYDQLNHDLDEEEIEFKRMIESSHGGMDDDDDDIENIFGGDDVEELSFSARDKDRLNMLEKLRSNLVAESDHNDSVSESAKNSGSPGSPEENSDDEEMRL